MKTPILIFAGLWQLFLLSLLIAWLLSIWAIIDIVKSRFSDTQKLMWVIISIFVPYGAIIYFFVGRKQKILL